MGIYIRDVKMPKSCESCPCKTANAFGGLGCQATGYIPLRKANQDRPDNCPLVPVPAHGDLIDRAVLINSFEPSDFWNSSGEDNCFAAIRITNSMPTIIPAEESIDIQKEFMQNWHEEGET